jgi:hypothetical protein
MRAFKAQEISSVALTVAKAFCGDQPSQRIVLPPEVLEFFACLPSALPHNMASFSTQSLTNLASAFTMVGYCDEEELLPFLGQEALSRAHDMESVDLLRLFQVFLSARSPNSSSTGIAGQLALKLADRLKNLRARDVRSLSRSFTEFLDLKHGRDLSRQELRDYCIQVANALDIPDASVPRPKIAQQSSGNDANLEVISVAGTEEPSSSLSEISDNIEEDAESSTEHVLSQHPDSPVVHMAPYSCNVYQPTLLAASFFHFPDGCGYYQPPLEQTATSPQCYEWMMQTQASWTSPYAQSPTAVTEYPMDCAEMWPGYSASKAAPPALQGSEVHDDDGFNTDDGF